MADNLMQKVAGFVANGLPPCYSSFDDYMHDFYPDLPWDEVGERHAVRHILAEHQGTLEHVQSKFGFNLQATLVRRHARDGGGAFGVL